jgi:hypothetical protein
MGGVASLRQKQHGIRAARWNTAQPGFLLEVTDEYDLADFGCQCATCGPGAQ